MISPRDLMTSIIAGSALLASVAWSANVYWDEDGVTAGFGTAGTGAPSTWAAPTPGGTYGWSTDVGGGLAIGSVTTTSADILFFGTDTLSLGSGTINLSGSVDAGGLRFGKVSGSITLNNGTINMGGGTSLIRASSSGGSTSNTHTINSNVTKTSDTLRIGTQNTTNERYVVNGVLSGGFSLDSRMRNGTGLLELNGLNDFTGDLSIVTGQINANTIGNSGVASSLGAGNFIGMGGGGGQQPRLVYTGITAAETNRTMQFSSIATSGIIAQNGALKLTGDLRSSSGANTYRLALTGTANTGTNEVSGVLRDNGDGVLRVEVKNFGAIGVTGEAGNWIFSGANTYTDTTSVFDNSTLQLGNGGTTGSLSTSSAISVASGSTFVVNQSDIVTQGIDFGNSLSGAGDVTMAGSGTLVIELGSASYSGLTTVEGGGTVILQENNQTESIPGWNGNDFAINGASTLIIQDTSGDENRVVIGGETFTFDNTGAGTLGIGTGGGNILWRNNNTIATTGGARNTMSGNRINMQVSHQTTFDVAASTDPDGIGLEVSLSIHNGDIVKTGAGTLSLTNSGNTLGTQSGTPNVVTINNGTIEIGNSGRLQNGDYSGVITNNGTFNDNSTADQILRGVIQGTGALLKSNTGTLTVSGDNTYSGATIISAGVLKIGHANALGSTAQGTTVTSGGALDLGGYNPSETTITLSGSGADGSGLNGALFNSGPNMQLNGTNFVLSAPTEIGGGSQIALIGGTPTQVNGNGHDLTTLGNIYNWQGNFTNLGKLTIDTGAFLGLNNRSIANNATSVHVMDGARAFTWGTGHTFTRDWTFENNSRFETYWNGSGAGNSNSEITGSVVLNGTTIFDGVANQPGRVATQTVSGDASGAGGITKTGQAQSTLILSGTNTYTGATTINNGTLSLNGTHTGGGTYTISVDAILAGSGSTDATVNVNGTISPGNSPESLATGDTTFLEDARYDWELFNTNLTAGTGWDLLEVTGTLTINDPSRFFIDVTGLDQTTPSDRPGLPIDLDISVAGATSDPFTIFTYDTLTIGGSGLLSDVVVNFGNLAQYGEFFLSRTTPTGAGALQLTFVSTVPEPGTWVLFLLCGSVGVLMIRRKSAQQTRK